MKSFSFSRPSFLPLSSVVLLDSPLCSRYHIHTYYIEKVVERDLVRWAYLPVAERVAQGYQQEEQGKQATDT